ncbi:uncharacterized protein LAESUDRAFT_711678 [Laetiporus sulphureus 93-53]|uniref:Uncharacterized protein n=1 Tax=Laetiporus sulphureus 93-53 TaxID=1314785 RepID=A0A165GLP8_9APHY|nr:uncharacterized protein LAESUDRAFT_711678 [Laetiporus sulphureus 93-53]KZT10524.1 hypothetical protein LAESUDRAFT_711678 [Laetiporus sulphureus 93-53]
MDSPFSTRSFDSSIRDQLSAKLELLSQLCLQEIDDDLAEDNAHFHAKSAYEDDHQWITAEYRWAMDATGDSAVSLDKMFDDGFAEEDMDACMPHLYDPTLFSDPRCAPLPPTRNKPDVQQRAYSEKVTRALRVRSFACCGCAIDSHPATVANDVRKKGDITIVSDPLPDIPRPSLVRTGVPDAPPPSPLLPRAPLSVPLSSSPPSSPLRSGFSCSPPPSPTMSTTLSTTPPSSPLLSCSVPHSPKAHTFPRSPQPSNSDATTTRNTLPRPSATQRHATYPSISSTLELLEGRQTPVQKRSGVLVTDTAEVIEADSVAMASTRHRSANASIGRSSGEAIKPVLSGGSQNLRKRPRPILPALTTSTSSPQLRTLALGSSCSSSSGSSHSSATVMASPMVYAPMTSGAQRQFPLATSQDDASGELPSRWSLDSIASRPAPASFTPTGSSFAPATPPQTPIIGRKRDRLLSFITRGRSGSVAKPSGMASNGIAARDGSEVGRLSVTKEPRSTATSPRPSFSNPLPPLPMAISPSFSTSSSSSTSSAASSATSLPTPADPMNRCPSPPEIDPFSPTSPSFVPSEQSVPPLPHKDSLYDHPTLPPSPPPEPTLPLPSPSTPSPSFLSPPRQQSFFSLALKRRARRRGKKLVITGLPQGDAGDAQSSPDAERRTHEWRMRYDAVVRWCESFGELRKIERKDDGSIHVYWREWEVADRVCRVQAQVIIKDVGRVSLAWHYTN